MRVCVYGHSFSLVVLFFSVIRPNAVAWCYLVRIRVLLFLIECSICVCMYACVCVCVLKCVGSLALNTPMMLGCFVKKTFFVINVAC